MGRTPRSPHLRPVRGCRRHRWRRGDRDVPVPRRRHAAARQRPREDLVPRTVRRLCTGQDDGARAIRRLPPRRRRLEGHPARPGRRHHRGRGPHVLGEPGLRPDRDRGGRAGHVPRQRPWGEHDHPAAGPPAPPGAGARAGLGSHRRAEAQGDHPVDQAHPGVPRHRGEAAGDDGVPESELLRQRLVRRGRRGADLFRQEPQGPDARAGGDHRGDPTGTVDVRPGPERRRSVHRVRGRRRDVCREQPDRARRASGLEDRPAPQPGARPDGAGPDAAHRRRVHGGRLRGGEAGAGRPREAGAGPVAGAALRVAGPRRADAAAVRRGRSDLSQDRGGRLQRRHDARLAGPAACGAVGQGGDDRPEGQVSRGGG